MRPYQIAATEKSLARRNRQQQPQLLGTKEAGGYIPGTTTGSGKTLTSFKTARRLAETGLVDKVIFIVDRKDLDHQTMPEYNNFKADSVSSTATPANSANLADRGTNIVVTTIRCPTSSPPTPDHPVSRPARSHHLRRMPPFPVRPHEHRHQEELQKYSMFGFTGTPSSKRTPQAAPAPPPSKSSATACHTYRRWRHQRQERAEIPPGIHQHQPHPPNSKKPPTAEGIAAERSETPRREGTRQVRKSKVLESPERYRSQPPAILDNYDRKPTRAQPPATTSKDPHHQRRHRTLRFSVRGFNSILATSSIDAACTYYDALNTLQEERIADGTLRPEQKLKVAIIYS